MLSLLPTSDQVKKLWSSVKHFNGPEFLLFFILFILVYTPSTGQGKLPCEQITAFPFLLIAPDAAAAGRGETGVATPADNNSSYYNIGKLAFHEMKGGASLSYTPWLRKIFDGASLSYLSGFWKPNSRQALTAAVTYFDLGNLSTSSGDAAGNNRAFALGYSRKVGEKVGVGLGIKYSQADLDLNSSVNSTRFTSDNSFSFDLGIYYQNQVEQLEDWQYSIGMDISNIGPKVGPAGSGVGDFSPANLRLGGAVEWTSPDDYKVLWAIDLNKLLVPSCVNSFLDRSVVSSMLHSFNDAPEGFRGELQEIILNTGVELWISQTIAARIGYSHQSREKGQQTYFTLGLGGRLSSFTGDLAYYLPSDRNHPFRETLRFSLGIEID